MTYVRPKKRQKSVEFEPLLQMVEGSMGFVPQALLTMAYWPEIMQCWVV